MMPGTGIYIMMSFFSTFNCFTRSRNEMQHFLWIPDTDIGDILRKAPIIAKEEQHFSKDWTIFVYFVYAILEMGDENKYRYLLKVSIFIKRHIFRYVSIFLKVKIFPKYIYKVKFWHLKIRVKVTESFRTKVQVKSAVNQRTCIKHG